MNTEESFLLTVIILISIIVIWLWLSVAIWISKKLRIPVSVVIIISLFTGGLGFLILLIMALTKEDRELDHEEKIRRESRKIITQNKK